MTTTETILVSHIRLPISDVKIRKETTSRLTGVRKLSVYDVQLQMRQEKDRLFCDVSFRESNEYPDNYYTVVSEKEDVLQLVQKTLNTLRTDTVDVPYVFTLLKDKDDNGLFEQTLQSAVREMEKGVILNKITMGDYLRVVSAITGLSIATTKGDLVPVHEVYTTGEVFFFPSSTLLYESIYRLL